MGKDVQIDLRISATLKSKFEDVYKVKGINRSSLLRGWITYYLEGIYSVPDNTSIPSEYCTNLTKRIPIRIDKETRNNFNEKNKLHNIDGSELITYWIYQYIINNE